MSPRPGCLAAVYEGPSSGCNRLPCGQACVGRLGVDPSRRFDGSDKRNVSEGGVGPEDQKVGKMIEPGHESDGDGG